MLAMQWRAGVTDGSRLCRLRKPEFFLQCISNKTLPGGGFSWVVPQFCIPGLFALQDGATRTLGFRQIGRREDREEAIGSVQGHIALDRV